MFSFLDKNIKENEENEHNIEVQKGIARKIDTSDNSKFRASRQYDGDEVHEKGNGYTDVGNSTATANNIAKEVEEYAQAFLNNNCESIIDELGKEEAIKRILASVSELSDMERKVIEGLFGINGCTPKTHEELAREMKISKDGIRYLERRALLKLAEGNKDLASIV